MFAFEVLFFFLLVRLCLANDGKANLWLITPSLLTSMSFVLFSLDLEMTGDLKFSEILRVEILHIPPICV